MGDIAWLQIVANGLMLSTIYILVALGLALIFSIMDIVNFAHGSIYMLGAFALYYLFNQYHINYILAALLVIIILFAFGGILERLLFSRVRAVPVAGMVISMGLINIFDHGC